MNLTALSCDPLYLPQYNCTRSYFYQVSTSGIAYGSIGGFLFLALSAIYLYEFLMTRKKNKELTPFQMVKITRFFVLMFYGLHAIWILVNSFNGKDKVIVPVLEVVLDSLAVVSILYNQIFLTLFWYDIIDRTLKISLKSKSLKVRVFVWSAGSLVTLIYIGLFILVYLGGNNNLKTVARLFIAIIGIVLTIVLIVATVKCRHLWNRSADNSPLIEHFKVQVKIMWCIIGMALSFPFFYVVTLFITPVSVQFITSIIIFRTHLIISSIVIFILVQKHAIPQLYQRVYLPTNSAASTTSSSTTDSRKTSRTRTETINSIEMS